MLAPIVQAGFPLVLCLCFEPALLETLEIGRISNSAREFTRIAAPYFRSEDGGPGSILLAAVIALQLFQVWLNVRFNAWYKTFYDALQNKDWDVFIWQLGVFSLLAAAFIVSAVYQLYLQQWLQIRWRRWLTSRYVSRWLGDGTHYRMRLKGDFGRQSRPAHRRRRQALHQFDPRHRHRPARLHRHADLLRGDPVEPVVDLLRW